MSKRPIFLFERLSEFNFVIAIVLSAVGEIRVFKSEFIFFKRLNRYYKDIFFGTKQEFIDFRENSFNAFFSKRDQVDDLFNEDNRKYKNALIQKFLIANDEIVIFWNLCEKIQDENDSSVYVLGTFNLEWLSNFLDYDFKIKRLLFINLINSVLYFVNYKVLLLTRVLNSLMRLLSSVFTERFFNNKANIKYVIGDISPFDHARGPFEKDFLWPIHNKLFEKEEILFILNTKADAKTLRWIESVGAHCIVMTEVHQYLSLGSKLKGIYKSSVLLVRSLFNFNINTYLAINWERSTVVWDLLWKELRPSFYFSSTSTLRVESPQTTICDLNSITAVNWAYANNEMIFSEERDEINDLTLKGSIFSTHKILFWDNKNKDLFERRKFLESGYPDVESIGPLMFGSSEVFEWSRDQIAEKLEINDLEENQFVISFFETPVVPYEMERRELIFNALPMSLIEDTFKMLAEILEEFHNVVLLFKAKKQRSLSEYKGNEHFEKLVANKRCKYLPHNVNQYLPILLSDMAVAPPISSTIDLCYFFGIPGAHYFPLHRKMGTYKKYFLESIVNTESEMIEFIGTEQLKVDEIRRNKRAKSSELAVMEGIFKAISK